MSITAIVKHYSNPIVKTTVYEFCKSRWVALEGSRGNERVFIRYREGKPLIFESPSSIVNYILRYKELNVRTVYASINIYGVLSSQEVLDDPTNIVGVTPFWDIDVEGVNNWRWAIEVANILVDFLEKMGVSRSVYLVWSGEGVHVRLHEKAIPPENLFNRNPIDVALAIVEYVLDQTKERIKEVSTRSNGVVKVENLIDAKRVFTAPLSLHRKHDLVAVVIDPKDLHSFDISWARMESFKTSDAWRIYSSGEAENLVLEAIKFIDKAKTRAEVESKGISYTKPNVDVGKVEGEIPRFQLMALLQAARYYLLTKDIEKAKSFGLNRAIFYAYLKHYGKGIAASRRRISKNKVRMETETINKSLPVEDGVEVSSTGFFMIGGKEQTPDDYDKNVVKKINTIVPYDIVWNAALQYVSKFPKQFLTDPQKFYEYVYEPVRDNFIKKVVLPLQKLDQDKKNPSNGSRDTLKGLMKWVKE